MRWITALDLERWADRMGARTALSAVVSFLIRAASKHINSLRFPTGDSAQLPGYDGRLAASGAGPFVPDGESVREFRVSSDINRKANFVLAIALLLIAASPAWAALSVVQTQTGAATLSPVSATATLTAGNAVIATLFLDGGTTPSQTAGDTLTQKVTQQDGGLNQWQYCNASVAGGSTTFTFSYSGGRNSRVFITEISGMNNGASCAAFDKSALTTFTSATTHSSGTTARTTQADEICIAQFHGDGSGRNTLSSLTNRFTVPGSGSPPTGNQLTAGTMPGLIATRIVSATGTYETTMTTVDSETANGLIGCYTAAATAGAPVTQTIAIVVVCLFLLLLGRYILRVTHSRG